MKDTKITLGTRHVVILSAEHRYIKMIPRKITKVKNGDNGFERFYATIDGARREVVLNTMKVTGAAFAFIRKP